MRLSLPGLFIAAHLIASPGSAQPQITEDIMMFEGRQLNIAARAARIEQVYGREALYLENGRAWFADTEFANGVIEYDIAFDDARGFAGLMFRAENPQRLEYIYLRPANSGDFDAIQYAPIENGNTAWQIFADGNALQDASFIFDGWNHVRIVVVGDQADVFVNGGREPVLHVPDLKTDIASGGLGFRTHGPNPASHISNIVARPLRPGEATVGTPAAETGLPEGGIPQWAVSSPFDETVVESATRLPDLPGELDWTLLDVETNGTANISRLHPRTPGSDTVLVAATIVSDAERTVLMRFGYADRARIFLNGQLLFTGNSTFNSRYSRFLGIIGLHDGVGLHLEPGRNELVVALSETFGGWGWTAAIEDRSGLSIAAADIE
ncbi:DUF1080 domain-containing protein [Parasphingopyxis algicola]|uniref:family 16 glycoside hydrolase n=1 Tax=Parasphingopyxis algicola TaxID=2026624 RepID=UPI00159F84A6|nr:family 16 glycoside hydrolase [Parasphingopyxis algicola]QLC24726.1 DUF1080 domain-containing protein [Parasphingopyxis algicola]